MKRTGFRRPERERPPVPAYRLVRACKAGEPVSAEPVRKLAPVRSEAYRRAVASLSCIRCGILGYSNHAHANTGKGAGMKVCDLFSFPLCVDRPGVRGCHSLFDQGALFPKEQRREVEVEWSRLTQRKVIEMGLWPQGVARP